MDFDVLPPEINSGLMYAGPGPESIRAAAVTWKELAEDLYSTARVCGSAMSELTGVAWTGQAAASTASAVAPYTAWLVGSAQQAELAAAKADEAILAFEVAFAMVTPPAVIAANRSQLLTLVDTNFLGQNDAAIAATEAQYEEMWAQDVTAMYGYAGASASASTFTPFAPPLPATSTVGLTQQAVIAAAPGSTDTQAALACGARLMSVVHGALSGLASPTESTTATSVLGDSLTNLLTDSPLQYLSLLTPYTAAIATTRLGIAADTASRTAATGGTQGRPLGMPPTEAAAGSLAATSAANGSPMTATMTGAPSIGGLTVPQGWTTAAPVAKLSAAGFPAAAGRALPTSPSNGPSPMLDGLTAASLSSQLISGSHSRRDATATSGHRPRCDFRAPYL
jgi:PPE-repeat protein